MGWSGDVGFCVAILILIRAVTSNLYNLIAKMHQSDRCEKCLSFDSAICGHTKYG